MNEPSVVLASTSVIRRRILSSAGVSFRVIRPDTDEESLKEELLAQGAGPHEIGAALARAKALSIVAPGHYVIGADQVMEMDGAAFDKPKSMREAQERLALCAGRAHRLLNAVTVARDGAVVFESADAATLHMRAMTTAEIAAYLDAAGDEVLASVGAYQVEALGGRLFERIEGDYFTVLGLSLFPLLTFLRGEGALPW